jgi:putative phage-type endonuclease
MKKERRKKMRLSNLKQGTPEWLEDRKKRVTASDAGIINGTNTFRGNSSFKLWQKKLDLLDPEPLNHAMIEGNALEGEALNWFNKKYSTNFIKPPGAYHETEDWAMASLDGYDEKNEYILEIKCGLSSYNKATQGKVPPYYFDQIQHQLFVSGKDKCYYLAYRPDKEPVVITIERDEEYIKSLIEKEKEFYDFLIKLIPPPLIEKEFIEINGHKATELAKKWREIKENLKMIQEMEKLAREALIDQTDGGNCIFPDADVKVERRVKKGSINYDAILKENGINKEIVEKYRKPEACWLQPIIIKR